MSVAASLFLVLFGCSDDLATCERLPVAPTTYVSLPDCRSQEASILQSSAAAAADYPTVTAKCMNAAQLAVIGAKSVDLIFAMPRKRVLAFPRFPAERKQSSPGTSMPLSAGL